MFPVPVWSVASRLLMVSIVDVLETKSEGFARAILQGSYLLNDRCNRKLATPVVELIVLVFEDWRVESFSEALSRPHQV